MKRPRPACRLVALLGIGAVVLATPALAADCPELVGQLPGPIEAVAVSGEYAYLGSNNGLIVADVSNPSEPRLVGNVASGFAIDVAVSGGYAYVVGNGLHVIDVSAPSAPVEVALVDIPDNAWGVAVSGDFAYLVGGDGLHVIDVSMPSVPVGVGFVDAPGGCVAVAGGYAYVGDGSAGLHVIDVSTPSAPVEVGSVGADVHDVAVSGGYAYVAGDYGFRVIDVSVPSAPVEVGSVHTGGVVGVAVSGGYAYAAGAGLHVVDVSMPSAPFEVGLVDTGSAADVAASGGYAYVVGNGLHVVDVSMPSAPVEVGSVVMSSAADVAVSGGYAYVIGGVGLRVIDVSTPSVPVEVRTVGTPGDAVGVAVLDGYGYVVGESTGLRVIDVSTPSAPVEVGIVDAAWGLGVAVSGGHASVAAADAGLRVINVSTPSAPVEVGFIDTPGVSWDVAVSGSYAYVAAIDQFHHGGGLYVIDVSTPSAPVEVGFVDTGGAWDVAVSGGYAYVVGNGLQVVDVSTPSAPVEVGFLYTPGAATGVAVSGGYAYVTGGVGLSVIDVSTPSVPVEVGFYEAPLMDFTEWVGVAVSDGHVFFADADAGLFVFNECTRPVPDARESFIPAAALAAGLGGSFFQTDVEVNNTGTEEAQVAFQWLPRGEDSSEPLSSQASTLAPGASLRYENVLTELFGLGPDSLGALKMVASTESVIGMSRTYNIPAGETAGTFGQGLPAIRATNMIQGSEPQRIIFLSENDDSRANVGCVNGSNEPVTVNIGLFNAEGEPLETKTMDLGPWSNDQINRVFQDYAPVNGYVDVWADSDDALYSCYGSMLDNLTSDPTTILPQVPSHEMTFIPAAALAAGLEGAFFETDLDLNNVGSTDLTYQLWWLPRGADNSDPVSSDTFSLAPGAGVRYANVLDEVFGLEPDAVGALAVEASGIDLLAMSRTYNLPSVKVAGTFGQELPGIPADRMIASGVKKRIIFMNENDDVRANVGCQNGSEQTVRVFIELFNAEGEALETKTMDLAPWSNNQITRVFRNYSPVEAGYVDVWTNTEGATIYCYGSVLDNLTSDPTTVLPQ